MQFSLMDFEKYFILYFNVKNLSFTYNLHFILYVIRFLLRCKIFLKFLIHSSTLEGESIFAQCFIMNQLLFSREI